MGQKFLRRMLCACMLAGLLFFSSCGGGRSGDAAAPAASAAENTSHRKGVQQCRMPEASGTVVYGEEPWSLDASHTEDGYVMVSYSGSADKIKVRITYPDDTQYIYPMKLDLYRICCSVLIRSIYNIMNTILAAPLKSPLISHSLCCCSSNR